MISTQRPADFFYGSVGVLPAKVDVNISWVGVDLLSGFGGQQSRIDLEILTHQGLYVFQGQELLCGHMAQEDFFCQVRVYNGVHKIGLCLQASESAFHLANIPGEVFCEEMKDL